MHKSGIFFASALLALALGDSAAANVHFWLFDEVYSNSSGTVQFIELQTAFNGQEFFKTGGNNSRLHSLATDNSVHDTYVFPDDLDIGTSGGTRNHTVLIGTAGLAAAAGVVPDFIAPDGFLLPSGGTIEFESDVFSTFATVVYPALPGGSQSYDVFAEAFGANTPKNFAGVVGNVQPPPFPGDANGDRTVNFEDLGILLNHYNQPGTFSEGDFNATGTVDFDDLGLLLNNYNQTAPASAPATAIPEPATLILSALGAVGLLIAARRHFIASFSRQI